MERVEAVILAAGRDGGMPLVPPVLQRRGKETTPGRCGMNTDEIRAALAAATPGPWDAKPLGSEGYAVTGAPDPDAPGVRAKMRRRIARFGYQDWDTDRANAELVANAPTWLAELLAEVDALTAPALRPLSGPWVRDLAEHYDGLTYANLSRAILGVLDGGAS